MHELSLTQSVVDICQENAGGRRVLSVTIQIGELSGVVPEALEFCFEACCRQTQMEGARLQIERIGATALCLDCATTFPLATLFDPCPTCGSCRRQILTGEEMRVKELEVE
jgi:hydrogenase nickel incorporation protein HypA/HybF